MLSKTLRPTKLRPTKLRPTKLRPLRLGWGGLVVALSVACAVAVAACDSKPEGPTLSPRSEIQVELPDKPSLAAREAPTRHADGAWTVEGLLRAAKTEIGSTVKVKGVVVFAHKCPADAAEGECSPPAHLYLADSKDSPDRWQLLVTGTESRLIEMAQQGLTLTMEGKLKMVSADRNFIRQSGLLVLPSDLEE